LCKIKEIDEKSAYFWSHYVEKQYRWDYGVWNFVSEIAFNDYPEKEEFSWTVAINNPSLERHINYGWFVSNEIVFESDEKWSSRELIKIDKNNKNFNTKDKEKYSDQFLKNCVWKENLDFEVFCLNSKYREETDFIEKLKSMFSSWYYLTRLLYDKSDWKADLGKTYVVFEKEL
jgi:hypothetical protein